MANGVTGVAWQSVSLGPLDADELAELWLLAWSCTSFMLCKDMSVKPV